MSLFPPAGPEARVLPDSTTRGIPDSHTAHMILMDWDQEGGWRNGRLVPYGPLELAPASAVVYYGQTVFEGMKAYRQPDGGIAIFRPWDHARRFRRSASRLSLPELPEDTFVEAVETLVSQDRSSVPAGDGHSLYLRPIIFGSHLAVGFRPRQRSTFVLTARATGPYFPGGVTPVRVLVSNDYVRAAPGGTGSVKFGGNYAAGLRAEAEAAERGCDEVLFLDSGERRWIEELGGMNLFLVVDAGGSDKLLTPPLTGTILPGQTRDAILTLASDLGIEAEEVPLAIGDWAAGTLEGPVTEAFACGTAAVLTPIGSVVWGDRTWTVGDGGPGPVTLRLRKALTDIQYGRAPDRHRWMHRVMLEAPSQV